MNEITVFIINNKVSWLLIVDNDHKNRNEES